jgi:hypothetical protein
MVALGDMTVEEAAEKAAGNWQDFTCFWWIRARDVDVPEDWAIIYTHNPDSGLLDQSNAAVIIKAMQSFADANDPDVVFESHSHWAVGHVDGFSIRVFKHGEITPAFQRYHDLATALEEYPILDESEYSDREYEATLENIPLAGWRLQKEYELPEEWVAQVYGWFSDNDQSAIENTDDQGGWPTEEQLAESFTALGFPRIHDAAT